MSMNILVVDDEKNIRKSMRGILEDEGHSVAVAESAEDAITAVTGSYFQIIFLDVMLPGMNGIDALKKINKISPESYVIMMSGHANIEMAVEATRYGAYNFFEKPLVPEKILIELKHLHSRRKMENEVSELRKQAGWGEMIGNSPAMIDLKDLISRIAPAESRVLISGENGTGKELVARAIHSNSTRKDRPFVKINCAALPKDLIESELFGYEKGAFTGATTRKIGRIEEAHTGTLFLDEVGDMSLDTQAKLLRVLEENELVRLGSNKTIQFDIRVISATNQDIPELINGGKFREDLYYRLRVVPVNVPPLRDRRQDIPLLVEHFTRQLSERDNKKPLNFNDDAMNIIAQQEWRGNVRELRNFVEYIAIMTGNTVITAAEALKYLPRPIKKESEDPLIPEMNGRPLRELLDNFESAILQREFGRCDGNVTKLAAHLKVDRANLHRKLKHLGVK